MYIYIYIYMYFFQLAITTSRKILISYGVASGPHQ